MINQLTASRQNHITRFFLKPILSLYYIQHNVSHVMQIEELEIC